MRYISTLNNVRRKIDNIDKNIVNLVNKRIILAREIGKQKKKGKLTISDNKRERQVLENVMRESALKGLNRKFVKEPFKNIIAETKRNER